MAVTIYYNGSDVTNTTVEIPLGSTATFTGVPDSGSVDRWFSSTSNDSIFTMSYNGSSCTVTPVATGSASYPLYCWDSNGTNGYVRIKVVDGGGGSSAISKVFCKYNDYFYSDGETITVTTGTTMDFQAYVMKEDGSTDSAGVYWGYVDGNKGYLTQNSSSATAASYTAVSAGTQDIALIPKSDGTKTATITIVVTGSATKTIDHIESLYNNQLYTSTYTINVNKGDAFEVYGFAVYSDDTFDTDMGIEHVLFTNETKIRLDEFVQDNGLGKYTALEAGETSILLMSKRTPSVYMDVTVVITDTSSPTLTGVRVSVDGTDYYDDFSLDIELSSGNRTLSVVSMGSDGEVYSYNNCAFEIMSILNNCIGYGMVSDNRVCVITPKVAGNALIKAYCTDDESKYIIITINVYEDATATGGYSCYIYTGSAWEEYEPYIYNGSTWEEYVSDICSGSAWTLDE